MRGFYKVHQDVWPLLDDEGNEVDAPDCVVLAVTNRYAYLHSARYPNPALEAACGKSAKPLGNSWAELHKNTGTQTRRKLFNANVSRLNDAGDVEQRSGRVADVRKTDGWDGRWLVPHAFSRKEVRKEQVALDKQVGNPVAQELQKGAVLPIQELCPDSEDAE